LSNSGSSCSVRTWRPVRLVGVGSPQDPVFVHLKDRYGKLERGSEWEPINTLLEGDEDSNKTNTASNARLRLITQVGQAHIATGVPLHLGTNTEPSEPKHTNTHR
jgi:hypothetical protein